MLFVVSLTTTTTTTTIILLSVGIVDQFQLDYQTHIEQLKNQQLELEQLKEDYINNDTDGLDTVCLPNPTPPKYIDELTTAYQRTTTALQKASHRVQSEINKHESLQSQLSHCEKRHLAIRNTLTKSNMNVEGLSGDVQSLTNQLRQLENELNGALEELDRRDLERVECDIHYRNLVACRGRQEGGRTQ